MNLAPTVALAVTDHYYSNNQVTPLASAGPQAVSLLHFSGSGGLVGRQPGSGASSPWQQAAQSQGKALTVPRGKGWRREVLLREPVLLGFSQALCLWFGWFVCF